MRHPNKYKLTDVTPNHFINGWGLHHITLGDTIHTAYVMNNPKEPYMAVFNKGRTAFYSVDDLRNPEFPLKCKVTNPETRRFLVVFLVDDTSHEIKTTSWEEAPDMIKIRHKKILHVYTCISSSRYDRNFTLVEPISEITAVEMHLYIKEQRERDAESE